MTPIEPRDPLSPWRRRLAVGLPAAALLVHGLACGGCGAKPGPGAAASGSAAATDDPAPSAPGARSAGNAADPATAAIGTNLGSLIDWDTEQPFVDVFKTSRPWISGVRNGQWKDGRPLPVDDDGWITRLQPDQVARTTLLWGHEDLRPGDYTVTFEGQGELVVIPQGRGVQLRPTDEGTIVVPIDPARGDQGFHVEIWRTNPDDPIRNIRVIPPGGSCEADAAAYCRGDDDCAGRCVPFAESVAERPFHPDFLATLGGYGAVRFMVWMRTNNDVPRVWAERSTLTSARYSGDTGVPVERLVDLANQLGVPPWFTLHITVDDDYVRRFAALVKERLDPELGLYIELSNEVWNSRFPQFHYCREQAMDVGLGDDFGALLHWYSQRAIAVFDVFDEAFGDRGRTVRVLSGQASNDWVAMQILGHQDNGRRVDALAIAPYFGVNVSPADVDQVVAAGLDGLVARTRNELIPKTVEHIEENLEQAQAYDLPLFAYEAGQHFVGIRGAENDDRLTALFHEINRAPVMAELYRAYLEAWKANGGTLLMHFVNTGRPTKWGSWGALEAMRQDPGDAPKYRALQAFIRDNPRWWGPPAADGPGADG